MTEYKDIVCPECGCELEDNPNEENPIAEYENTWCPSCDIQWRV